MIDDINQNIQEFVLEERKYFYEKSQEIRYQTICL